MKRGKRQCQLRSRIGLGWHVKRNVIHQPFEMLWQHSGLLIRQVTVRIRPEGPMRDRGEMVITADF